MTITVMIMLTQFRSTRPIAVMLSDNGEIADIKHPDGHIGEIRLATNDEIKKDNTDNQEETNQGEEETDGQTKVT